MPDQTPLETTSFTGAAAEEVAATPATPEVVTPTPDPVAVQAAEQVKQYSDYFDALGGFETAKPMIAAVDQLTGPQFEVVAAKKSLEQLAGRERFSAIMWQAIDDSKQVVLADLLADPNLKQTVFSQDPDWALFQQWKTLGGPDTQLDLGAIDPESDAGKQFIALRQQLSTVQGALTQQQQAALNQAQAQARAQAEQQRSAFINAQYTFLEDACKKFNWGDDAKEDIRDVMDIVENRFSKSKTAMDNLAIATKAKLEGNDFQAARYERIVQKELANLIKEVAPRREKDIVLRRTNATAALKVAEQRKEVVLHTAAPSSVGAVTPTSNKPARFDFGSALEASLLKAAAEGRLPNSK